MSMFLKEYFLWLIGLVGWCIVVVFNWIGFECDRYNNVVIIRYIMENIVDMEWQIFVVFQSMFLILGFIVSLCLVVLLIWFGQVFVGQFFMLIFYWNILVGLLCFIICFGKWLNDYFVEVE